MGKAMRDEELGSQPQGGNGGPTATTVFMSPGTYPNRAYVEGTTQVTYSEQLGAQVPVPSPAPIYGDPIQNNTSVLNPLLRIFAFVFSLIAFALMVSDNKNGAKFNDTGLSANVYLLSINAIVMAYSLVQAIAGCMSLSGASMIPSPTAEYLCFICDALFTILAVSCSSAATGTFNTWMDVDHAYGYVCDSDFCHQLIASIAMSFIAFIFLLFSAVRSGFLLAKVSGF